MRERLLNVFVYGDATHAHSMGHCEYEKKGSYEELINFLRSRASVDCKLAKISMLKQPIEWEIFSSMQRFGSVTNTLIEDGIMEDDDIYCITYVVNGKIRVDESVDTTSANVIPDYLSIYLTSEGFNFPRLIEDDFFSAIKLLWNANKYISSIKLLFTAIDTFGFIEFGAKNNSFMQWLDEYCDLRSINVTSQEIWELRNSLLHMTNLDSYKVRNGSVERLFPAFTHPDVETLPSDGKRQEFSRVTVFICYPSEGDRKMDNNI